MSGDDAAVWSAGHPVRAVQPWTLAVSCVTGCIRAQVSGCRSPVPPVYRWWVPELSRLRGLWENQHPIQSASSHLPEAGVGRDGMRMDEAERRRREFIRVNHPDRGGDPDAFIAGMRSFGAEAGSLGTEPLPKVVVVSHRSWLTRLAIAVAQRLRHGKRAPRVR